MLLIFYVGHYFICITKMGHNLVLSQLTYFFPFSKLQKPPDNNVFNLSAQDLLSKSHEELVLLLIHLRRQMATLSEAIDGSRSELENITNTIGK